MRTAGRPPIEICINRTLPSWNTLKSSNNLRTKGRITREWHDLVQLQILAQVPLAERKPFKGRVRIDTVCLFKHRGCAIDSDNLADKLAIDGLKGTILLDDKPECVGPTSTESRIDLERAPLTIIRITELEEDA